MKILFLHGWTSTPGGRKPTYLNDHGHTVINPTLPDDDFDCAVRIAQAEFDRHHPAVVVGSSRGGAVAMHVNSGDTPLVLLCPAWKRWGTATTVKSNTTILHSQADDVVPFADSEELIANSGLPPESLIEIGTDHRLADPEPLKAMLEACIQVVETRLRRYATWLRAAIDRAIAEHPDKSELPFINHWPKDCCDAPYLFLLIYDLGHRGMIRVRADVSQYGKSFQKHVWMVVDGITVDISADQFPDMAEPVIVSRFSEWHNALPIIDSTPWAMDSDDELYNRYVGTGSYYAYEEILPRYAPPFESF